MRIGLVWPSTRHMTCTQALQRLPQQQLVGLDSLLYNWTALSPSPNLLVLAALTPSSHEVEFIDEDLCGIDFTKQYDLIGITGMTSQMPRVYQIADEFRKRGTTVVLGGIHATVLPDEAKQHADSVVIGEAEHLWPIMLQDVAKGTLRPVYVSSEPVDLHDSPVPRYELLKQGSYSCVTVQTSRGCPHDCDFCVASSVYGRRYRFKDVEQVLTEVKRGTEHLKTRQVRFCDDNLFADRTRAKTLLKRLAPLKIRWSGQCDVASGEDPELLELARESGCIFVYIGLESVSTAALCKIDRHAWKLGQLPQYATNIQKIQDHGIGVLGSFMVGFDTDTPEVFQRIGDFVVDHNLLSAIITFRTPLPGSRLRHLWQCEGREMSSDWSKYTLLDITFTPKQMSRAELEQGVAGLYERIYSKEVTLKRTKHMLDVLTRRKRQAREQERNGCPMAETESPSAKDPNRLHTEQPAWPNKPSGLR